MIQAALDGRSGLFWEQAFLFEPDPKLLSARPLGETSPVLMQATKYQSASAPAELKRALAPRHSAIEDAHSEHRDCLLFGMRHRRRKAM
jgi:hypothetical protein